MRQDIFSLALPAKMRQDIFNVAREILKVRKVGGTLVVTLTQAVLEQISLGEGDRVLIEALPPRRILISKEQTIVPATYRVELELGVLEAKKKAADSEITLQKARDQTIGGMLEASNVLHPPVLFELEHKRDLLDAEIAQKRLELFELGGASS
jgi:antitoxin component of MazEF toxin-antitoxin module